MLLCVFFLYVLTVYAKDGGLPPNYAKATVRIRVLDENDNAPFFGRLYYNIEVPENLEALPLFTLRATDQDAGESGKMNYKITGENLFYSAILFLNDQLNSSHNFTFFLIIVYNFYNICHCCPCSWRSIWRLPLGQTVRCAVHFKASG